MKFSTAVSTCLSKYATFSGRATRSEFWWFYLFTFLVNWIAGLAFGNMISMIISLAFVLPLWAAGARRRHRARGRRRRESTATAPTAHRADVPGRATVPPPRRGGQRRLRATHGRRAEVGAAALRDGDGDEDALYRAGVGYSTRLWFHQRLRQIGAI